METIQARLSGSREWNGAKLETLEDILWEDLQTDRWSLGVMSITEKMRQKIEEIDGLVESVSFPGKHSHSTLLLRIFSRRTLRLYEKLYSLCS